MSDWLADAAALAKNNDWLEWVGVAAVSQARDVFLEADTVANHDNRMRMAKAVLANPDVQRLQLARIIAADQTVASKGTTAEAVGSDLLLTRMGQVWDYIANVYYAPPSTQTPSA